MIRKFSKYFLLIQNIFDDAVKNAVSMDKFQVIQSGFVNNVTSKLGLLFKNKNNNKTNKLFKHEFDGNSAELFLFFL